MTEEFMKYIKNNFDAWRKEKLRQNIILESPLYEFLREVMSKYNWSEEDLIKDKYPLYCFIDFRVLACKDNYIYEDNYWSLQQADFTFGPVDNKKEGTKNREKFIMNNSDKIIYAPYGKSFKDKDTFYDIQSEYVEEALKTNQKNARKLILSKYGRK